MKARNLIALLVLAIGAAVVILWERSSPEDSEYGRTGIRLQLQWFDQTQFAGFYVAKQQEIYSEAGLDVHIMPGGYASNPIQAILDGRADVALATGDQVVVQRAQGKPIVAIGTVFDGSVACFMSRDGDRIYSPQDLRGKTVGVYPGFDTESILLALLSRSQIPASEVNIVSATSLAAFEKGDIQVFPAYEFNEPNVMERKGIKTRLLKPAMFGVNGYSDTIITTEDYLRSHRSELERFVAASSMGWARAARDVERAVNDFRAQVPTLGTDADGLAHQTAMLRTAIQRLRESKDDRNLMEMNPQTWRDMATWLQEIGRIPSVSVADSLCDYSIARH